MQNYEVIGVTNIMFELELMFDKLIEFVEVNIGEELGGEVAEREASIRHARIETENYLSQ